MENEAARSMARTGEIGSEDWKWGSEIGGNFLESDLKQLSWATLQISDVDEIKGLNSIEKLNVLHISWYI